jgi:hypothetical protein
MLPIQVLNLLCGQALELRFDLPRLSAFVARLHPEQQNDGQHEYGTRSRKVEAIANAVVWTVKRQEGPRGNQPAYVSKHDVGSDGGRPSSVGDDVGRHLSVGEGAEGECAGGDEERGGVTGMGVRGGEENDVAHDHKGAADDEEDGAPVISPAEEWDEEGEKGTNDIWRYRVQLQKDYAPSWVDRGDDCWCKESQSTDGDVVEEENKRCRKSHRAEDALEELGGINLIQDFGCPDTFRLHSCNSEVLLIFGQPFRRSWPIGQGEEGDEGDTNRDNAFDGEYHPPRTKATEVTEFQDTRGQETAKSTGKGSAYDVERQAEG